MFFESWTGEWKAGVRFVHLLRSSRWKRSGKVYVHSYTVNYYNMSMLRPDPDTYKSIPLWAYRKQVKQLFEPGTRSTLTYFWGPTSRHSVWQFLLFVVISAFQGLRSQRTNTWWRCPKSLWAICSFMRRRRWKNWRRPGFYQRFGQNVMLFHKAWQVGWQSSSEPCKNPPFKGRAKDTKLNSLEFHALNSMPHIFVGEAWAWVFLWIIRNSELLRLRPHFGNTDPIFPFCGNHGFSTGRMTSIAPNPPRLCFVAFHVRVTLLFDPLDCTGRCISGILIQTKSDHRTP